MKKSLFFLTLCLIFVCNFLHADIVIPEKFVQPLYEWYVTEFTIEKGYFYYSILRSGRDIEINGVKISSSGKGDINIDLNDLNPFEIWTEGKYIYVGCISINPSAYNDMSGYYRSYFNSRVSELLKCGETVITPNNSSKGSLRVRIKK